MSYLQFYKVFSALTPEEQALVIQLMYVLIGRTT